ncbi:uncharacterized protein LOC129600852 isoform X2 [Paramacrobiotus metropolitanus]|nr:uncharacterized protein LOC129600852 isoform X2 [Paramacrobiotus metropolitanus]
MESCVGLPLLSICAATFYSLASTVAQLMMESETARESFFWAHLAVHNLLHLIMTITLIILVDRATSKNGNIVKISRQMLADSIRLRHDEMYGPGQPTDDEQVAIRQRSSPAKNSSVAATGVPSRRGTVSVMERVMTAAKWYCPQQFYAFRMVTVKRVMIFTVKPDQHGCQ